MEVSGFGGFTTAIPEAANYRDKGPVLRIFPLFPVDLFIKLVKIKLPAIFTL
jgi:hypothetical protein